MDSFKTIVQAINYLLKKTGQADKLKIVKLLFLADKLHLLKYARTITGDDFFAMKRGPVGSKTLDLLNQNMEYLDNTEIEYSKKYLQKIDALNYEAKRIESEYEMLSESDKTVLDEIALKFGKLSGGDLVELVHQYPEWKYHEDHFKERESSIKIKVEEMFSTIKLDKFNIDEDHIKESKDIYCGHFD